VTRFPACLGWSAIHVFCHPNHSISSEAAI
jgi:predicted 3-demethylubiquinone-9 3-methyltransferase (glyoxalase superfamily)